MKQNMYCHGCGKDFTIDIDMNANGNHVFNCPHCKHEHCRVVKDGVVTSDRWDQRNGDLGAVYYPTTTTITGTTGVLALRDSFLVDSWGSTSTATIYY